MSQEITPIPSLLDIQAQLTRMEERINAIDRKCSQIPLAIQGPLNDFVERLAQLLSKKPSGDLGQLLQELTASINNCTEELQTVTTSQAQSDDSVKQLAALIKRLVELQNNNSQEPSSTSKFLNQSDSPSWD